MAKQREEGILVLLSEEAAVREDQDGQNLSVRVNERRKDTER